jgi:LPXTG-motif cell wall-anchored protein
MATDQWAVTIGGLILIVAVLVYFFGRRSTR